MLREDSARIVKVEAPDVMAVIGYRKGFGEMQQMLGCLINEYAMAKLLEQHGDARASSGQIMSVVRQYVHAIGRAGQQEMAQSLVARLSIKAYAVKVLLEKIQVVLRESAQRIQRRAVVFDAIELGVLHSLIGHAYPRCFLPMTR